jgi:hypothetical protein
MIFDSVKSTSSKSLGILFYFPSYYMLFLRKLSSDSRKWKINDFQVEMILFNNVSLDE